ncbi:hypothetical protein DFH08DRAFT_334197 [Mycena albidolilacea]|uniref:F-box domain-containing protein n=1 Tax=Mycena albidolilacea TaxID=1033008 RepID=A0AAD6ZJR6_9AGAR|nr:hypothetical protein DFH08DRAFT_334197 [Mycena albidolilacea]
MLGHMEADRARLIETEARILDHEDQMACLARSLFQLRAEKMATQGRLDAYKYPVLKLPNEIVSEIFVHFLPVYPRPPPLTGIRSPTWLTLICRKWREIALATPALWRAIGLTGHIPYEQRDQISEIWIKRTGSGSLSIKIHNTHLSEMIPAVVAHRARWEHLHLRVCVSALSKIMGPMPLLSHLHLKLEGVAEDNTFTLHEVPQLRTVALDVCDFTGSVMTLPWGQLTSLRLDYLHPSDCVPILQQTTNLIHCGLHLRTHDSHVHSGPDMTLPFLESLTLTLSLSAPVPGFLHAFTAPALRSLHTTELCLEPNPIATLTAFISKSGCRLHTLHIRESSGDKDSYIHAFSSIPDFSSSRSWPDISSDEEDEEDAEDDSTDSE